VGKLARLQQAALARGRRVAAVANSNRDKIIVGATSFGLGMAEKNGVLPSRLGPIDSCLATGIALGVVLPIWVKGSTGKVLETAGMTALGIGLYKIGAGAPILGDDEGGYDFGF
jgi:hypothetical protein